MIVMYWAEKQKKSLLMILLLAQLNQSLSIKDALSLRMYFLNVSETWPCSSYSTCVICSR